jgi:hypothetical protein
MSVQADGTLSDGDGRTLANSSVTLSQVIMPAQAGPDGVYAHDGH